jgi:hypothetical protein
MPVAALLQRSDMPFALPWFMPAWSERTATLGGHAAASVRGQWLALVLLLCTYAPTARSQTPAGGVTLFGKVQDAETKAALPFLTLQLQTERDSAFVGGRFTNEQGAFTFTGLKKGSYLLVVRSIGYQPIRQRVLVGELSAFLDLGAILLIQEARTLGDVRVTANADAVAGTMDKKTFTVSDNITQAGGSVLQARG